MMTSASILFDRFEQARVAEPVEPAFFADLNLDQVITSLTAGRSEYNLEPLFYRPLHRVDSITYRHEVMRDLQIPALSHRADIFAEQLRRMRGCLSMAARMRYTRQRQRWLLDAAGCYVDAVAALSADLSRIGVTSRGLCAFRDHLAAYVASTDFTVLAAEVNDLGDRLADVRYCVDILGGRVTVSRYQGETDYGEDVTTTFARFRSGHMKGYLVTFADSSDMNHVEAGILDRVAQLYPDVFTGLDDFCSRERDYVEDAVAVFDREVQFYLAYRDLVAGLIPAGLVFCYPQVSDQSKEVAATDTFDLAMAAGLVASASRVVCNDFHLTDPERIFVVSGPNQGGKTTFARTFGQLHYLASLGLPVPGRRAHLYVPDELFTHFEREEDPHDQNGKLQDDLIRIHRILQQATPRSVVIMNEIFTSTTLEDAVFLGSRIVQRIIALDLLCVCVTFVDELASLGPTTVSLVSTVVSGNPSVRTFKVERRPADGLSHAMVIAQKYGLTYEALRRRVASS